MRGGKGKETFPAACFYKKFHFFSKKGLTIDNIYVILYSWKGGERMGRKRAKKSRRKMELATAILVLIAAILDIVDKILDWLLN